MIYDVQYFIDKFEQIPDEKWAIGNYEDEHGAKCSLGHCGVDFGNRITPEGEALMDFTGNYAARINDGKLFRYQQLTPKARILAALRDLL